jgi:hypothetical protein
VRGWRLDLEHPWKRGADFGSAAEAPAAGADATDRYIVVPIDDVELQAESAGSTLEMPAVQFGPEELSSAEVLEIVESSVERDGATPPPASEQRRGSSLADRVRRLANGDRSADAAEALADLRRTRARAEGGPPAARCQAALALAMTLGIAGRPEEALLAALDALARAREAQDPKALGACMALLAKLYAGAGRADEAAALRDAR